MLTCDRLSDHWWKLTVKTSAAAGDLLVDALRTSACLGAEVETTDGGCRIEAYFPHDVHRAAVAEQVRQALGALRDSGVDVGQSAVEWERVEDEGWSLEWRKFFRPVAIGDRLWICPPWAGSAPTSRVRVEIEPGQAFGTGTHPTTQLCLQFLESVIRPGSDMVDLGTGSGILTIAAIHLGASRVLAVDYDEVAVASARVNLERNGVLDRTDLVCADFRRLRPRPASVLTANLTSDLFLVSAPLLVDWILPGGCAILSGVSVARFPEVRQRFEDSRLRIQTVETMGEWVGFTAALDT